MALTMQTMTDEQRKAVALEYFKALDKGGVTSDGHSMFTLFDEQAQALQLFFMRLARKAAQQRRSNEFRNFRIVGVMRKRMQAIDMLFFRRYLCLDQWAHDAGQNVGTRCNKMFEPCRCRVVIVG